MRCDPMRSQPSTQAMKPRHSLLIAAAFGISSAATAPAATVVDTFTGALSSQYTLTRVLDNGIAEANISFSTTGGALRSLYATGTNTNQAEQVVLLRDDYSLAVGQMLTVDVSMLTGNTNTYDFGIIVANTKTPTAATVGNTDTRKTMQFAVSMIRPGDNSVRSFYYDGSLPTSLGSNDAVLTVDEANVSKLWIKRNTSSSISMGYTNNLGLDFTSRTVTTFGSGVGTAIGFYTDLRTNGATLGPFDNLTIVPEPSSAALAGLAALALASRRRR